MLWRSRFDIAKFRKSPQFAAPKLQAYGKPQWQYSRMDMAPGIVPRPDRYGPPLRCCNCLRAHAKPKAIARPALIALRDPISAGVSRTVVHVLARLCGRLTRTRRRERMRPRNDSKRGPWCPRAPRGDQTFCVDVRVVAEVNEP
jgi:hypothetical protein